VDVHRDGAELVAVLAGVVGAEEKLASGGELDAEVGLGAAAVTAVCRCQCAGCNCCSHECLPFLWVLWSQRHAVGKCSAFSWFPTQQSKHVEGFPRVLFASDEISVLPLTSVYLYNDVVHQV
jgi:hypothetical protein